MPHTSTPALTAATLPYVLDLAHGGIDALGRIAELAAGANVARGKITNAGVAEAMNEQVFLGPRSAALVGHSFYCAFARVT